jgi:hypothetical protein
MKILDTNQLKQRFVPTCSRWKTQWLPAFALLGTFLLRGNSAEAQQFIGSQLTINATTTTATSTVIYSGSSSAKDNTKITKFGGADLGNGSQFDFNTGSLTITLASDTLNGRGVNTAGNTVTYPYTSSTVHYRVYAVGTTKPSYTDVSLGLTSASNTSIPTTYASTGSIDLFALPRLTGGGTYQVDVYFDAIYKPSGDPITLTDPGNGGANPYSATFTVKAPDTTPTNATTIWQGTISSAWFEAGNWTNGVPNNTSNAIIPENVEGSSIKFPVLNNQRLYYAVRNLTLRGITNSGKAQLTIQNAVLHVYGDISQLSGGLVGVLTNNTSAADSTQNSTLVLAGGGNQSITGRLSVPDIIVAGSGIKSVANVMLPTNRLIFRPQDATLGVVLQSASLVTNNDGTVTYNLDTTGNSLILLGSSGSIGDVNGGNETTKSFVNGIIEASGELKVDERQQFGSIGLDFIPNHAVNAVRVQRIIGDPLLGPTTPAPGVTPKPVKRQFNIIGDDNSANANASGSNNTIIFHYLDSPNELNGIQETNLALFRTNNGTNAAPYTALGGIINTTDNTVTRASVPTFNNYYITLGDKTNPLPVSLVAFTAVRSNANTTLAWTTASELNNSGFEVQVSNDGATFRKLAFVASQNPNSNQALNYSYTDTENGKNGIRYYRLRQLDISGEEAFSPVRAVSFSGSALASTGLAAYPNPFVDKLDFNLDATAVGTGLAHVQLVDMTGRLVREQNVSVANASLSLSDLASLRSGLYMAKVTLPDGTSQTIRIQKQ